MFFETSLEFMALLVISPPFYLLPSFTREEIPMKKSIMSSMLGIAVVVLCEAVTPTDSYARNLTVVSWGGTYQEAQRKAFFDPFMKETGQTILDESYNGQMAKVRAMVEVGNVTWDVVQAEAPEVINACEQGLLEIIDWDKIGDQKDFIPSAVMGECGVGNVVWAVVLAYNGDRIKGEGPKNWADFWDVNRWPGKRALRKSAKFSMEIALMADGVPPSDVYKVLSSEAGVQRAFKKLDALKPHLQWWEAGAQPPQWLASGDVVMTSTYNGRISVAIREGRNFRIAWNGQLYSIDSWVIVKGTPNLDLAYAFIKFASQPENQAAQAANYPIGPTHLKAIDSVDPKIAVDLPTYPANMKGALELDTEWWVVHQEELKARFHVWASR
jgi:putative spermidine/putrescine transport system substrate-binding protein